MLDPKYHHAPGVANTAAVVTLAAPGNSRVSRGRIAGFHWSYDILTLPAAARLTVTNGGRVVTDGVTATNTTVTSATAAFTALDVGRLISGTGIPVGARITAVNSATSVTISAATTASASSVSVTISGIAWGVNIASGGTGFIPFANPQNYADHGNDIVVTLSAVVGAIGELSVEVDG